MEDGACKGCGALIGWITSVGGKHIPVDRAIHVVDITANPPLGHEHDAKRITLVTEAGTVETGYGFEIVMTSANGSSTMVEQIPGTRRVIGHVPHWATCPTVGRFRTNR